MQPYPIELRERVWRAMEEGATSEEAAEVFGIDPSCARKWRAKMLKTGTLAPAPRTQGRKREFTAEHDAELIRAIRVRPDAVRRELAEAIAARFGRLFCLTVITDALQRLGYSRKKNSSRHRARSAGRRRRS